MPGNLYNGEITKPALGESMAYAKTEKHAQDCPCCQQGLDAYLKSVARKVQENGYAIVSTWHEMTNSRPIPLTYTVGMHTVNLPELVVFNVPQTDAIRILMKAAGKLLSRNLKCSVPQADILRDDVYVQPVSILHTSGVLNIAEHHADRPVDALQIVLGDVQGRFPWDEGCDPAVGVRQPLLYLAPGAARVAPVPSTPGGDSPSTALYAANKAALESLPADEAETDAESDPIPRRARAGLH
jgi:hypothetical protein